MIWEIQENCTEARTQPGCRWSSRQTTSLPSLLLCMSENCRWSSLPAPLFAALASPLAPSSKDNGRCPRRAREGKECGPRTN